MFLAALLFEFEVSRQQIDNWQYRIYLLNIDQFKIYKLQHLKTDAQFRDILDYSKA